jgi:ribosomal RNA assembly protein
MMFHETIRVPVDRIGVIVGRNGRVKKRIEKLTQAQVDVNSEGMVTLSCSQETENPVLLWKARNIIRAMARGFSPKNAFTLLDEDARLIIISLREFVGTSQRQLRRVSGRIIGENGKTRKIIEQTTETKISVYGRTVSIIGIDPGIEYARKAIDMLIEGAPHSIVYKWLEKMRRELNRLQAQLWEETDL